MTDTRPDIVIVMTDEERATPPYEGDAVTDWRTRTLRGAAWFEEHGVSFTRHYTGSLACVPSRPTIFTGHYPDLHGVTQTDGIGKAYDDSRLRWLRPGEVPPLGNWFRAAGYDTHYDGKWHISHADLIDENTGQVLATNNAAGDVDQEAVDAYAEKAGGERRLAGGFGRGKVRGAGIKHGLAGQELQRRGVRGGFGLNEHLKGTFLRALPICASPGGASRFRTILR